MGCFTHTSTYARIHTHTYTHAHIVVCTHTHTHTRTHTQHIHRITGTTQTHINVLLTSNDLTPKSIVTSTGGLLTLVLLIREIIRRGPHINKISSSSKPPPMNNFATKLVGSPNILGSLCKTKSSY